MGEVFATATAVIWAGAVILFKKSGETVPPFALNLFRVIFSLPLFLITALIAGTPLLPPLPLSDYLLLCLSGIIGIAISDTFFHMALNRLGAGLNAIIDCLYSPFVAVFAFVMLGETLGGGQLAGMVFVIGGVLVAANVRLPEGMERGQLVIGICYAILAMATIALGIVLAKQVLPRVPVLWATLVRQLACAAVMLPVALILPKRRAIFDVFRPRPSWKFTLTGSFLGSYLALTLWIAGMKYTETGSAAILNQTSTIFVLILASLFLREPFGRRKAAAAVLALVGIVLVTLAT